MNSYRNTVKRAMALLNLALQGMHVIDMCHAHGLLMADHLGRALKNCNSMKDV